MLAAILKSKRGLLVAAVAGGVAVAGVGPATASAKLVVSDTIHWKGIVWNLGSGPVFEFGGSVCTLNSDNELTFPECGVRGSVAPGAVLHAEWGSADGTGSLELAPAVVVPTKAGFTVTGTTENCIESDAPNPLEGSAPYPCVATVRITANTGKLTGSGTLTVKELSTQP